MTDGKVNEKIGHVFQQIIYLFTCKELKLEKIPLNALSVGRAVSFQCQHRELQARKGP